MHASFKGNQFRNKLLLLSSLFLTLVILSACAGAATPEAPAEPVQPEEPYPVLYGQDSRTEIFQDTDSKLREMAASVGIFVRSEQVNMAGNSVTLEGYTLNEMSEMGWLVKDANLPMCSEELFTSQTAPGFCTGFLVKEDILVTAGHCLQKTPCSDTSIVFGYQMESSNTLAALTEDNVFQCAEVIAQEVPSQENQYLDYTIIKLDRPTGRAGLDYVTDDLLEAQTNVAVLGYPSGLPLKIASNAFVMNNNSNDPFFVANLDTFGSNSGSPVINANSYQVEGILVRGMTDYVLSSDGSCVQVNHCPEGGGPNCAGENATKMARLATSIPDSTDIGPSGFNCYSNLLLMLVLVTWVRLKRS
jgi:V8-like Glu-specific endopeptidase